MSSVPLDTPFLEDGIRSTHFFNGRLLSGEDLRQEQLARGEWLRLLGRSAGEGIVHGLEVSAPIGVNPAEGISMKVGPGLALTREGQALELRRVVEVPLTQKADKSRSGSTSSPGEFQACTPSANVSITGTGLYLLTLAPDEGYEGLAPVSGLGPNEPACNAKRLVEGVRFQLLRLEFEESSLGVSGPDDPLLRNRVAHLCFGTEDPRWVSALTHPFGEPPERYGLLDDHRPGKLTGREVPLALLYWQESFGIRFMDMGSVRRRPTRVEHTGRWAPWLGERRASEAEAVLLQFQEQLEALRLGKSPELMRAMDHFDYLPPAGVLPLQLGALKGFSAESFFEGIPWRKYIIEGDHLAPLLRQSLTHAPIKLGHTPRELEQQEFLWVYLIRQNQQAQFEGQGVQPYLVFASGHLPYRGDARANVARVQFSHVALPKPGEEPSAR